jgi:hypothetical protein
MADYTVISSVNKTLISLLFSNIKDDSQVNSIITNEDQISLSSPKDLPPDKKLSLFLYRIAEFSSMKNQFSSTNNLRKQVLPPLYLSLHYLIVPYTQNIEGDDILLGKIMQVFSSHAVLRGSYLQGSLADDDANLRLEMESLSIDEINKLWGVFGTHYRLSLSYSVSPVRIDLTQEKETARVVEQRNEYQTIPR